MAALVNIIAGFLQGVRDLAKEIPFLDKAFSFLSNAFNNLIKVVDNLQSVFAGAQNAAQQFAKNIRNSFKGVLIDLKIFGKQIKMRIIQLQWKIARAERNLVQMQKK